LLFCSTGSSPCRKNYKHYYIEACLGDWRFFWNRCAVVSPKYYFHYLYHFSYLLFWSSICSGEDLAKLLGEIEGTQLSISARRVQLLEQVKKEILDENKQARVRLPALALFFRFSNIFTSSLPVLKFVKGARVSSGCQRFRSSSAVCQEGTSSEMDDEHYSALIPADTSGGGRYRHRHIQFGNLTWGISFTAVCVYERERERENMIELTSWPIRSFAPTSSASL
jgi:hypothetical protein